MNISGMSAKQLAELEATIDFKFILDKVILRFARITEQKYIPFHPDFPHRYLHLMEAWLLDFCDHRLLSKFTATPMENQHDGFVVEVESELRAIYKFTFSFSVTKDEVGRSINVNYDYETIKSVLEQVNWSS